MSGFGLRSQSARIDPTFALVSTALHAVLFYGVSRGTWIAEPPPLRPAPVVWFEEPVRALVPTVAPEPEPAPPEDDAPVAEPPSAPEPARSEPAPEPADPGASEPPAPLVAEAPMPATDTDIDFEAARQEAVALVVEQLERERNYRTFSLDDLVDEEPPPAEPAADQDVFAGPSASGPSVLRPSRARTRLGRALLELCNDLTGGLGVGFQGFGLFTMCAEEGERADFFGHLRPAYLEKLPVCTEQELTEAQLAAAQRTDPSEVERTVVKCRLVDRDEVLVVPE